MQEAEEDTGRRRARPRLTYDLAMAAARDAANRQMRARSLASWGVDEWNLAAREFARLWPAPVGAESERATERAKS